MQKCDHRILIYEIIGIQERVQARQEDSSHWSSTVFYLKQLPNKAAHDGHFIWIYVFRPLLFNPVYTSGFFNCYILDEPICHFRGAGSSLSLYFFFFFLWKILLSNNVNPYQTPHNVASDLSLHCLPMTLLRVSMWEWVKGIHVRKISQKATPLHNNLWPYYVITSLKWYGLVSLTEISVSLICRTTGLWHQIN